MSTFGFGIACGVKYSSPDRNPKAHQRRPEFHELERADTLDETKYAFVIRCTEEVPAVKVDTVMER